MNHKEKYTEIREDLNNSFQINSEAFLRLKQWITSCSEVELISFSPNNVKNEHLILLILPRKHFKSELITL